MASYVLLCKEGDDRVTSIRITAAAVGVELEIREDASGDASRLAAGLAFATKPLLLTEEGVIPGTVPIMQFLASLRPGAGLQGDCLFADAEVDQWLQGFVADLAPNLHIVEAVGSNGKIVSGSQLAEVTAKAGTKLTAKQAGALRKRAAERASAFLSMLQSRLAGRTYLVSECLTLADIAIAPSVLRSTLAGTLPSVAAPDLTRWALTCAHHPALAAVLGPVDVAAVSAGAAKAAALPAAEQAAELAAAPAVSGAGADESAAPAAAGGPSASGTGGVLDNLGSASAGALSASPAFPAMWSRGRSRFSEVVTAGLSAVGETVTVGGWVRSARKQRNMVFIDASDGSTMQNLQLVVKEDDLGKEAFESAVALSTGTSLRATGTVVATRDGKGVEVDVSAFRVLGTSDASVYPIAKGRISVDKLREVQHLRPRTRIMAAVTRVRNACAFATHRFYQERGFLYIHTPLITCSDCEGAGEMFGVTTLMPEDPKGGVPRGKDGAIDYKKDFFGKPAALTVSGQLQVESFACAMCDVYTFGPTFRAENSNTARHLAEFWMIEPEIAFAGMEENMALAEDFLKYCTAYVLENCAEDVAFFDQFVEKGLSDRLRNVVANPFHRITYTAAVELLSAPAVLKKAKFEVKPVWGEDLRTEHEKWLTDVVFQKPVIVTDYPRSFKAFYMRANDDGKTVQAMDILVPRIGEIIGGSVREERLEVLEARMDEMDVPKDGMQWYLDLRKYGSVPHAGFGMGFERLVMYVTGMANIRDVIPFPRFPGHADV